MQVCPLPVVSGPADVYRWEFGLWQWSFDIKRPEAGFQLTALEKGEGQQAVPSSAICQFFCIEADIPQQAGELLEADDAFITADRRLVVRYREPTQDLFQLILVASCEGETQLNRTSTESTVPNPALWGLRVTLLLRTERLWLEPGLRVWHAVDASERRLWGDVSVSLADLKASTVPFMTLTHEMTGDSLVFPVEAFLVRNRWWLSVSIHPLESRPVGKPLAEGSKWESPQSLQALTRSQKMTLKEVFSVFPEAIEKGVTYAARGWAVVFPDDLSSEQVRDAVRCFLLAPPPLSEG